MWNAVLFASTTPSVLDALESVCHVLLNLQLFSTTFGVILFIEWLRNGQLEEKLLSVHYQLILLVPIMAIARP